MSTRNNIRGKHLEEVRDKDNKLITFSVLCCTGVAAIMFFLAPLFPNLYHINREARQLAFLFSHYTALPVMAVYVAVQLGDTIKCTIGFLLVKKGSWLQNIVG